MNDLVKLIPTAMEDGSVRQLPAQVRETLEAAAELRVPIQFLGLHPLFDEVRVYHGPDRDWMLAPAGLDPLYRKGEFPVPKANLELLRRLEAGGLRFPAVYIGHDVRQEAAEAAAVAGRTGTQALVRRDGHLVIPTEIAHRLVPAVPPPTRTVDWSRRLGVAARAMVRGVGVVGGAAVGIAAAPLFVASSVFAGLTFADPVLFGAVPLIEDTEPGAPAAWFLLAEWSY